MLILSRRADETVCIGDDVTFTILSIKGNQVRIGIKAPPDVAVHRQEIYDKWQAGETHVPPTKTKVVVKPATPENVDAAWEQQKRSKKAAGQRT